MERSIGEMRVLRLSMQFAAFVMLILLMACTSTKFKVVRKDEAYQERPRKILVMNELKNPATRRLFEDELVKSLKERGVDAVVSYTNMPDQIVSDKKAIEAQANAIGNMPDRIMPDKNIIAAQAYAVGADTVLISKTRSSGNYKTTGPSGAEYNDMYIMTQTDVYDLKSNSSVLTVIAETWIREGEPAARLIQSYIKDLVNELSRLGLF